MLELENLSCYELDSAMFDEIFETLARAYMPQLSDQLTLEVLITDSAHTQELNTIYRGKANTTDVLSFPLEVDPRVQYPRDYTIALGTIVINAELSLAIAQQLGHTLENELKLLFIHGFLHIFGFDHECDDGAHRREECGWIERFCLPKSLIERSDCV